MRRCHPRRSSTADVDPDTCHLTLTDQSRTVAQRI
jgi:hypothetical protein